MSLRSSTGRPSPMWAIVVLGLVTLTACAPASQPAAATSGPQPAAAPKPAEPTKAAAVAPTALAPEPTSAAKPTGPLQTVRMAQSVPALSFAPLYVARDMGYFEQQGIKLEFTELQSGATAIQALIGGNVDVVDSASTELAAGAAQGLPILATQGTVKMTLEVCASKDWMEKKGVGPSSPLKDRMAAFKGATIAITGPGAVSDRAMRWLLQKYGGLDPNVDTTIVQVGGFSAMPGALQQGRIHGFLLSPPTCEIAVKDGSGMVLVKPSDVPEFANYVHEVLFTTRDWAKNNRERLMKTATAISMGNNYMLQHPKESIALLQRFFSSVDPKIVEDSVNQIILPQVPKDGKMTEAEWKATNNVLVESGLIKEPIDTREGVIWTNEYIGDARVP